MILRCWRGYAGIDDADRYPHFLLTVVRPKLDAIPGFAGLMLLRTVRGQEVEYCVQTLWASMEAIKAFAGPTPERAVVEPEAAAALVRYDREVVHYDILAAPFS